jgi:hypothetical protein
VDAGGPCEKNAPHKNVQTIAIGADYVQRRAERHSSDRSGIGGSVLIGVCDIREGPFM